MSQESKPLNYSDHGSGDAATNQTSDALRALGQATAQTHSDWWLQAQISNYGAEQARPPSGPTTADSRPNAFSTAFQAQAAAYEAAVAASAAPTASPLGILARFTSANLPRVSARTRPGGAWRSGWMDGRDDRSQLGAHQLER